MFIEVTISLVGEGRRWRKEEAKEIEEEENKMIRKCERTVNGDSKKYIHGRI